MVQNTDVLQPILIERGNYLTHCGYAGQDSTQLSFRTLPINIENQFKHIFDEVLKVDPTKYRVVLIKDAGTKQHILKKEAQILFSKFKVKACAFCNAQRGVIYSTGIRGMNGLIIDIGYSKTLIVPIIDVITQSDYFTKIPFGGKNIEQYIINLLKNQGITETVIDELGEQLFPYLMKEYFYFDSNSDEDFEKEAIEERKKKTQEQHKFLDKKGNNIKLNLPHPILPTSLITGENNSRNLSLSKVINTQIVRILEAFGEKTFGSNVEHYDNFWWVARIVLSGGPSNILGLRSLLIRELLKKTKLRRNNGRNRVPSDPLVDIMLNDDIFTIRNISFKETPDTWIGGSIEWSLSTFLKYFISKETYQNNPEMIFPIDYKSPWDKKE